VRASARPDDACTTSDIASAASRRPSCWPDSRRSRWRAAAAAATPPRRVDERPAAILKKETNQAIQFNKDTDLIVSLHCVVVTKNLAWRCNGTSTNHERFLWKKVAFDPRVRPHEHPTARARQVVASSVA
jgi:hypothetical protein